MCIDGTGYERDCDPDKLTSMTIIPSILPSAALIYTSFRSVLNMCRWHIAPSIAAATAAPHSYR